MEGVFLSSFSHLEDEVGLSVDLLLLAAGDVPNTRNFTSNLVGQECRVVRATDRCIDNIARPKVFLLLVIFDRNGSGGKTPVPFRGTNSGEISGQVVFC
jgi:hypothetical protein